MIADVSTRWVSTYQMMAWIVEQHQAICAVLAEDRNKMSIENEFAYLEDMLKVLEPLSKSTDTLTGEKRVTIASSP